MDNPPRRVKAGWEAEVNVHHEPPHLTLGAWLREARRLQHLHQADVACHLGVSRPLVSRWEADTSIPDVHQFAALVELFDAPWLHQVIGSGCAA